MPTRMNRYHCQPARHCVMRCRKRSKPAFPSVTLVMMMAARVGPAYAFNANNRNARLEPDGRMPHDEST